MHGPLTTGWLLTALCAATGLVCLFRACRGAPAQREAAGCEAVMSLAMASMACPTTALPQVPGAVHGGLFALLGLWALAQSRHGTAHLGHWLLHAAGAAAMAWSALTPGGHGGHEGHTAPVVQDAGVAAGAGPGGPLLATLLLCFAAQVVLSGRRLLPQPAGGPAPARFVDRPELASACRVATAAQMLVMLSPG